MSDNADSLVEEFFRDRSWPEITLESLQDTYPGPPDACLSFMSAEAFRYYMPGFMSIFLEHWDQADAIADATVFVLVPTSDARLRAWQAERFEKFNSAQRRMIFDFLTYAESRYGDEYEFVGLPDALHYWREAARQGAEDDSNPGF